MLRPQGLHQRPPPLPVQVLELLALLLVQALLALDLLLLVQGLPVPALPQLLALPAQLLALGRFPQPLPPRCSCPDGTTTRSAEPQTPAGHLATCLSGYRERLRTADAAWLGCQ
ncbi:MAG TPA: hypothetical protein VFS21_18985 [Roseiflexaceae bacterium]|nr:hypothetical protein [Roseiflexaceae bacterium]